MRSTRAGWTLIELMIVSMVIAILVGISIPLYINAVEKSQLAQALSTLRTIRNAQISYYTEHQEYSISWIDLGAMVGADLSSLDNDYWTYAAPQVIGETFTLAVTRTRGRYAGAMVTLNELDVWGGNHPLLDPVGP